MLLCNCPVDLSPVYSPGLLKKTWYSFCSSTHDVYILYILHKINNEYNCTNLIAHVKECKHNLLLRSTTLLYPTTCAVLKLQQITALTTVKKENVCISDHTVWNCGACFHFQTTAPDCPKFCRRHTELIFTHNIMFTNHYMLFRNSQQTTVFLFFFAQRAEVTTKHNFQHV